MVILIGNLPKQAAEKDLCRLLELKPDTKVRVIKKSARNGVVQRFALVPVENDKRAARIIAWVHGREWQGQTLVAHPYQRRTGACERRRPDWRSRSWSHAERRLEERRSFAEDSRSLVA